MRTATPVSTNLLSLERAQEIARLMPAQPKFKHGDIVAIQEDGGQPQPGVVFAITGVYFDEENWTGATWEYQIQIIDNPTLISEGCLGFDMYTSHTALLESDVVLYSEAIKNER